MTTTQPIDDHTRQLLVDLAGRYETAAFLEGDPSWWMHQWTGDADREAVAFVAQALSYGSRPQFMKKIGLLFDLCGGAMHRWVLEGAYAQVLRPGDSSPFYRLYSNGAMNAFLGAYRQLLAEHGSLGAYVARHGDGTAMRALALTTSWFSAHGDGRVVPGGTVSACKRLCMFLRWMARDGSPVDLGLWSGFVDRRSLIMPFDTHVLTEAARLGLCHGRTASMGAALRLTATVAGVFPDDPLRADFALFGYGVQREKQVGL